MAWSTSRPFRQTIADMMTNTAAFALTSDTIKNALYNTTAAPDADATAANSAYNVGTWTSANEVSSSSQWAAGGVALANKVVNTSTTLVVMFDADDTASTSGATLVAFFGSLIYDSTLASPVANQGICFNYFGGTQTVTSGTLTVVYSASGIMRITIT